VGSLRRPERLSGCRFRVVLYCRHAPAPKGFDPNSMQQWRSRLITPGEKEPENIFGAVGRNGSPELGLPVVEPGKVDAMTVIEDRVLVIRRITLPPEDKDRFYGLILDDIMPRMFDLPGMLRAEVFGSETEVLIMVLWESEDHRRAAFDIGDIDFPQFRRITDLPQSLDILHYRYHATGNMTS
jgi:hypothetical protein